MLALSADIPQHVRLILSDAQTSGGLLFCVQGQVDEFLQELQRATDGNATVVGRLYEDSSAKKAIRVLTQSA